MSDYLKEHIHEALTKALSEAVVNKPTDPIDFVGNYLLKIVNENKVKDEVSHCFG